MTIQELIWNCRGLKKKGVATFIKDLIYQYKFHFIGLQKDYEEKLLKKFDPQQEYLWLYNSVVGRPGGILVGVKLDLYDVGSFQQGKFMLQMNLWDKMNKIKWNLLIAYGAAHEEKTLAFLAELSSFCSRNSDPILIGGDFNIIRFANERNRQVGVQRYSDLFNTLIDFYELRELEVSGGMYTWSNNQEIPILEK